MKAVLTLNAIARATSGASGAELANIINEAALRAVRDGTQQCAAKIDLEESCGGGHCRVSEEKAR